MGSTQAVAAQFGGIMGILIKPVRSFFLYLLIFYKSIKDVEKHVRQEDTGIQREATFVLTAGGSVEGK